TFKIAGQRCAERASDHDAGNRRARASGAMANAVAQQAADQRAGNDACRIHRLSSFLVKGIVVVGIGSGIALAPPIFARVTRGGRWRVAVMVIEAPIRPAVLIARPIGVTIAVLIAVAVGGVAAP